MASKFALIGAGAFVAICSLFGKDVYVSSSSGDDKNDGSLSAPLRTIAAAPKDGVNLFLKRGDVFFETLQDFSDSEIDAYGEGNAPLLCGLKILENDDAWVKLPNGIWRLDLSKQEDFGGYKAEGKTNNMGAIYFAKTDKVYGHLVRSFSDLSRDGDFWVSDNIWTSDVRASKSQTFRYLYFKFDKNPADSRDKIGFITYSFGIRNLRNCTVKNVAVKGFGVHGVSRAWNCKFSNLDIDLIGGSVQLSYRQWVRLGNGIEFWISAKDPCNDNLVENCRISRTYDCGTTIQGHCGKGVAAKNIKFSNNSFFRCRQAFEHFLSSKEGAAKYENCEFSNNNCFDMGENEYSSPETRDANLLSYERNPVEGLVVKNNIFWGAPVYSVQNNPALLKNNTFYVYKGQYLYFNMMSPQDTIWANSDADAEAFEKKIGGVGNTVKIVSRNDKRLKEEVLESFTEQKETIKKKTREKYRRDFFYRK